MSETDGPLSWTTPPAGRDPWLNGQVIHFAEFQWDEPIGAPIAIRNAAGGARVQRMYRGGSAPARLSPGTGSLRHQGTSAANVRSLRTAVNSGRAVDLCPHIPHPDVFDLVAGQTVCSPSRRFGWGIVTGMTTGTSPARAFINGVEQTVIYGADPEPDAGEVGIVDTAGAQWRAIRIPAATAGHELVVWYDPLHRVILSAGFDYNSPNALNFSVSAQEALVGRWD
jgi:hypothetical protein